MSLWRLCMTVLKVVEFIISQVFKLPGGSDIVTNDHYYFHTFYFVSILQDTQQIYK